MNATLEQLGTYENFKTWDFGRMSEARQMWEQRRGAYAASRARGGSIGSCDYVADAAAAEWPDPAPWAGEPDKVQWIDPSTDLDCLIVRNHMGALCGYVGVPPEHPFFNAPYDDVPVDVHGGLTFAGECDPSEGADKICHVAAPGRAEVYWLGFDCGHFSDLVPAMLHDAAPPHPRYGPHYRNLAFVVSEIEDLAEQLAALASEHDAAVKSIAKMMEGGDE